MCDGGRDLCDGGRDLCVTVVGSVCDRGRICV